MNLHGKRAGGVVIIGQPGAGKSALIAQLICSRASNAFVHERIIGYHLCRYYYKATQDLGRFVRNLVNLIARRIPEYEELISNNSFIHELLQLRCLRDPYFCFHQAIAGPLQELNNRNQSYFILVDALDECSSDDAETSIVQFIRDTYNKLPNWIRFVMTSRNDSTVLKHFSSFPKLYLSSKDARNHQDIHNFLVMNLKLSEDTSFRERLKVRNELTSRSQGNFLSAKEMPHYCMDGQRNDIDLNKIPKTLFEIYDSYMRREYGSREKFKHALRILEILVASFQPMNINLVFKVLRIQETIDYEYEFVYTLRKLSHFITYGPDNTIILYHQSFKEWLTCSENHANPYYVSSTRGHTRLAEYYLTSSKENPNNTMDIYRLAKHLSFISLDKKNDRLLDDFRNIKPSFVTVTIDGDNRTLLHLAAAESNSEVLRLLIPAFEDIDSADSYGFTPAFVAAMNGLVKNVELLTAKGASLEHRTNPPPSPNNVDVDPIEQSRTAFWNSKMMHAACSGGFIDVVRLLLKNNASLIDLNGVNLTPMQLAVQNSHLNVVQLLYKQGAPVDHLCLQFAAKEANKMW